MRSVQGIQMEGLMECFEGAALTQAREEQIRAYLEGEGSVREDFDLGIGSDYGDLWDAVYAGKREQLITCFTKLEKRNEKQKDGLFEKFFDVAFQFYGMSLWSAIGQKCYYALRTVPKKKAQDIVVLAYLAAIGNYIRPDNYRSVYKRMAEYGKDPEMVNRALKYAEDAPASLNFVTDAAVSKVRLMILACLFYEGQDKEEEMGRICFTGKKEDVLIGGKKVKRVAAGSPDLTRPEFSVLVSLLKECAGLVFAPALAAEDKKLLDDYLSKPDNFEKPIPQEILNRFDYSISRTYGLVENMEKLIIPLMALTYRKTPIAANFLRLMMYFDTENVSGMLSTADMRLPKSDEVIRWYYDLTPNTVPFILWSAYDNHDKVLKVLAESEPEAYLEALGKIRPDRYSMMLKQTDSVPKDIYQKYYASAKNDMIGDNQKKILDPLVVKGTASDGTDLEKLSLEVIRGEKPFSAVEPYYDIISKRRSALYYNQLKGYIDVYGEDEFILNVIVYSALKIDKSNIEGYCSTGPKYADIDLGKIFELFDRKGVSLKCQLSVAMEVYENSWGDQQKAIEASIRKNFSKKLSEGAEGILDAFAGSSANGRVLGVGLLDDSSFPGKKDALLAYVKDTSKQVKAVLIPALQKYPDWGEEYVKILSSKKAGERELAANVLAKCGPEYREAIQTALDKEKNEAAANAMRAALGVSVDASAKDSGAVTAEDLVKDLHKGGKKRSIAWLFEESLGAMPVVHRAVKAASSEEATGTGADAETNEAGEAGANAETKEAAEAGANAETNEAAEAGANVEVNGSAERVPASEEYLQAILLAYSGLPTPGVSEQGKILAAGVEKGELALYMQEVYDRFMRDGAEAKKKWVLYATAIHGGSAMVPVLKRQIDEWAAASRGAIAAEAIKALALNDSPTALLIVDNIARKYKFKQVRNAAKDALSFAASQLGLTVEELSDRIVPDLGFNDAGERVFDYGTRSFTVRISPALDIIIKNNEGKQVKNMPAPGKTDDETKATAAYAEFKEMKTQMKTVVKNQSARLELALSSIRLWTKENWEKLFVKNPIMHQFAISLIWGVYDDNLKPVQTFRYMEDGTFNTVDEDEYTIPDGAKIGLIHPVEISDEEKKAWKEQLEDYEIKQSIEQLSRPIYLVEEAEKNAKLLSRFNGDEITDITLTNRMVNMGWEKGEALDAGIFVHFYREDKDAGLGVELAFSGAYIGGGYDYSETVTVEDARFYRLGTSKSGYGYDHIKDEDAIALSEIPERYFSEIVYQLTKATLVKQEEE